MRSLCLLCLMLAPLAYGQTEPSRKPGASGSQIEGVSTSSQVNVGPGDPVITLNHFCAGSDQENNECKTVITRAQFEKLIEALQPDMALPVRLNVANAYARNLKMSAAAEMRGLDKTSEFAEELRYARIQLLSQDLDRALQADAQKINDAELAEYYKKNESLFEQATVERIFVPHAKQVGPEADDGQRKAAAGAMTKVATDLRQRAVNGEDMDQLQIEAYVEAGLPRTTSNTKLVDVRRTTVPPQHEAVMDLKPGEVSEVFSDPEGAHFIYKMISKKTLTLDEAKSETRAQISSQRYRESMKPFRSDIVFNDAYFIQPRKTR